MSELVSNAVMHGTGTIAVALGVDEEGVHVVVSDRGVGFSPIGQPVMPPADAAGGRGLALVAMLSVRWGRPPRRPHRGVVPHRHPGMTPLDGLVTRT